MGSRHVQRKLLRRNTLLILQKNQALRRILTPFLSKKRQILKRDLHLLLPFSVRILRYQLFRILSAFLVRRVVPADKIALGVTDVDPRTDLRIFHFGDQLFTLIKQPKRRSLVSHHTIKFRNSRKHSKLCRQGTRFRDLFSNRSKLLLDLFIDLLDLLPDLIQRRKRIRLQLFQIRSQNRLFLKCFPLSHQFVKSGDPLGPDCDLLLQLIL